MHSWFGVYCEYNALYRNVLVREGQQAQGKKALQHGRFIYVTGSTSSLLRKLTALHFQMYKKWTQKSIVKLYILGQIFFTNSRRPYFNAKPFA